LATLAAPGVSATARSRSDVTDHDLVQAVRAGDDHAFERLYHRYHRRIAAYIFGMVRDHGRAEDLTQEVFVSALRRMRSTDRPIAFKPWVYEIAKNASIDAFRRSRRTEEVSYDADDGLGAGDYGKLVATSAAPEAAVDAKQRLDHLCGAFGGLSEAHHQILVMRELEGLSYREIGERLGMSRPSVESTLFRARRRLTEEYEELVTGERCLRIQAIIAGAGSAALGTRDQRRVGSHISHCQPCRKHARLAGIDAGALARRPVRAKIAAFLPLPAFLRRRWLPGGHDGGGVAAAAAQHGPSLTQLSATASQYGEPAMSGWVKVTAFAAALALTGVGAGTAVQQHGARDRGAPAPRRSPVAPSRAAAHSSATRTSSIASSTGTAGAGHRRGAAHGGSARGSSTGAQAGTPSTGGGSGVAGSGVTSDTLAHPGSTAGDPASTVGAATNGTPAKGQTGPVSSVTGAVGSGAASGAAGAVGGSSGTGAPIVAPDATPLLQPAPGASTQAPPSPGQVVKDTTAAAGTVVGGVAGQAVKDTGATAAGTADQAATAAGGLLGGR
jgi:RNA polymerase sigma factor (sigma-70 family)